MNITAADEYQCTMRPPESDDSVYKYYSEFAESGAKSDLYSIFNPGELYMRQTRERVTLKMLKKLNQQGIRQKDILEVGCGRGHQIGEYLRWGALSTNITAIDLLPAFVDESAARFPGCRIMEGSAMNLPVLDESFDIVSQSTVMSSIPANADRQQMADEMIRVLKPGGIILWSDFRLNSPGNKNVRKVSAQDIRKLFAGLEIHIKSNNLLPPLVRKIAPVSYTLTSLLDTVPLLHSHLRGVFIKKELPQK